MEAASQIATVHMRPLATDGVAWSVGLSACDDREPCKNDRTDQSVKLCVHQVMIANYERVRK